MGMRFKCNIDYYKETFRYEYLMLNLTSYAIIWSLVQIFASIGVVFNPSKQLAEMMKAYWSS